MIELKDIKRGTPTLSRVAQPSIALRRRGGSGHAANAPFLLLAHRAQHANFAHCVLGLIPRAGMRQPGDDVAALDRRDRLIWLRTTEPRVGARPVYVLGSKKFLAGSPPAQAPCLPNLRAICSELQCLLLYCCAGGGRFIHTKHKTLNTVQALRALAASGVLFYHVLYVLAHRAGYLFQETDVTASGVDLFFVISGFIMFYTTVGEFGRPNASYQFIRRRAIRIVPLYWLCTAVVALLLGFFPHLFRYSVFEWNTAIPSFFFVLSKNSAGKVGTILQTGWTLCFEFYFYVIFAILLRWPQKLFLPASAAVFVCGICVGQLRGDIPIWASMATDPLLMEFFAGTLIALLFIRGLAMPGGVAACLIVLGAAVIGMTAIWGTDTGTDGIRVLWWGLPSAAILIGAISLERLGIRVPRFLVALGNSSYSLYLTHPFVLPVFGKLGFAWHISEKVPAVIFGMLAFVTSLFVGHAVYRLVEVPLTRYFTAAWRAPVVASSAPAT